MKKLATMVMFVLMIASMSACSGLLQSRIKADGYKLISSAELDCGKLQLWQKDGQKVIYWEYPSCRGYDSEFELTATAGDGNNNIKFINTIPEMFPNQSTVLERYKVSETKANLSEVLKLIANGQPINEVLAKNPLANMLPTEAKQGSYQLPSMK